MTNNHLSHSLFSNHPNVPSFFRFNQIDRTDSTRPTNRAGLFPDAANWSTDFIAGPRPVLDSRHLPSFLFTVLRLCTNEVSHKNTTTTALLVITYMCSLFATTLYQRACFLHHGQLLCLSDLGLSRINAFSAHK